jgi:hypothetical protein
MNIIAIKPDGEVIAIYNDELAASLEKLDNCHRISEVEFSTEKQEWIVKPYVGPFEGSKLPYGFKTRAEAINAEISYLGELIEQGML